MVDDDAVLRTTARTLLVRNGFRVLEASDGLEAFKIQETENIDLWLLDICMPNCDGLEVIQRLRKENSSIPVVCMSASHGGKEMDYTKIALKFGANARLYKPFTEEELVDVLNSI